MGVAEAMRVAEAMGVAKVMTVREAAVAGIGRTAFSKCSGRTPLAMDCFTGTVMASFEDFGFCPKGQVGAFFAEGRATYGGDVVVNPHGGLLSEGYLHGLNHHFEAVTQLRGDAGERQVLGARHALVTAGTGAIYSYIVVRHPSVPAFAQLVPYVIALVEFDEGPRLPGILLGEDGPGVAIGQRVRAELTAFPGAAERAVTYRRLEPHAAG